MKILLVACNAKYIHSNLAVYDLQAYASDYADHIVLKEYTINQQKDDIMRDIYLEHPDVVCVSCYIWNLSFVKELMADLTLNKLNDIFQDILKRQADKTDPIRSKFGKIEKEEVTLPEKLEYVYEYAKVHHRFSFRDLLKKQASKVQIIVTFLAVLELMKTGEIQVYQEHTFDDIIITSDEGLWQGV